MSENYDEEISNLIKMRQAEALESIAESLKILNKKMEDAELKEIYHMVYEWCKKDLDLVPSKIIKIIKEIESEVKLKYPKMPITKVRDMALGKFLATRHKYTLKEKYEVESAF